MVSVIIGPAILALVLLCFIVIIRGAPPHSDRQVASYRDQKYENPDWVPGHSGA